MNFVHYLPGGGLGNVYREGVFHNAIGILKRWKNENPKAQLSVLLMSHNPSAADLFTGCDWIDELKLLPFRLDVSPDWESCYQVYADEFRDKTELRFGVPDHRSLYRSDMALLRPKHGVLGPVQQIPAIGAAWSLFLDSIDRAIVEAHAGMLVVHPYAGEDFRAIPGPLLDQVFDRLTGHPHVVIGANYVRAGHGTETGCTFDPRVLAEIIRHSRGVLGTDSAPCYFASCQNVPRCMVYPPGIAFDRMMQGDRMWDWYFNLTNPENLYVRTPIDEAATDKVLTWMEGRLA